MTAAACRGFVYATAVMGVTGAREQTAARRPSSSPALREVTDLPVGVGLGVSQRRPGREVAEFADAVIVGSALVRCCWMPPTRPPGSPAIRRAGRGPARRRRARTEPRERRVLHPQPVAGRLAPRPAPAAGLRAVHHRRRRRRDLDRRAPVRHAAAARDDRRRRDLGVPFGIVGGRLYHVITDPGALLRRRRRTRSRRSRSGRAASASGAPSRRRRPRGLDRAAAATARRSPPVADALAPGLLVAQAIGRSATTSTRSCSASPTTLPWGLEIDPTTGRDGYDAVRHVPPHVPLRAAVEPRRRRR